MSPTAQILLTNAGFLAAAMLVLWIVGTWRRDASIADPFWGVGFALVAWIGLVISWPATWRVWLLVGLTTVWGLRLSLFLLGRNWGQGEDRRYAAMRERHGARFWWVSAWTVFALQGLVLWFVSLPLQIAAARSSLTAFHWLDAIGIVAWSIGWLFETGSDWQLARFKTNPANKGRVLDRGLWRYTRHPNYFGDFCVWWGLYLLASASGGWWTIASPLLMSWLLMRVSGVALLERSIVDRRPEYAAYQARTNGFFPGWPKPAAGRDGLAQKL
jgi:steroid 5-alpha reductase family enzyme